jgi:inositol transport system ATP-binding protein
MAADSGNYILQMRDVVKTFPGVKALDGVNLNVRPGTVHVICGENGAGKSTLMKVLNGTHQADGGEIWFKGKKIEHETIDGALGLGIAMIYQELNPVLDMTVAENIFLGQEPRNGPFVDFKKMYAAADDLIFSLDIPIRSRQKMRSLSIANHQMVEIAKAVSREAQVIIMDEPTSAIADAEVAVLFNRIEYLKNRGVAVIYITHKMDEIFKIADDITIIRDGRWVDSGPASKYDSDKLVSLMVGREISSVFPKDDTIPVGDVALEVKNLTQGPECGGRFKDISFDLRRGEILGFAGLVGAGRSEVMRSVFGLDPFTSGTIAVNGKTVKIKDTADAIKNGIAMISEDRKMYGLALGRSVHENISLVNLKKYVKNFLVQDSAIVRDAFKMKDLLSIKIPHFKVEANTLSGGNQQKIVLAKWLTGDVKIMILDEPTRGIDVGAKAEIHRLMGSFARQGMAIIMISSELPEILGMSDRVVVMREGRVNGVLSRSEATQESIMKLATTKNTKNDGGAL